MMIRKTFLLLLSTLLSVSLQAPSAFAMDDFAGHTQEDLNIRVAQRGVEVYAELNDEEKFRYPVKNNWYVNSEDWDIKDLMWPPTGALVKKRGVPASEAFDSLLALGGRIDCRIAQYIVLIMSVRDLLGDVLFNSLCTQFEAQNPDKFFSPTESASLNPYFQLLTHERGTLHHSGKLGYFGYTPNIKEYARIHHSGPLRGECELLCGEPEGGLLHIGYGPFYKAGGRSWEEIVEHYKEETLTLPPPKPYTPPEESEILPNGRKPKNLQSLFDGLREREERFVEELRPLFKGKLEAAQREIWRSDLPIEVYYVDIEKLRTLLAEPLENSDSETEVE